MGQHQATHTNSGTAQSRYVTAQHSALSEQEMLKQLGYDTGKRGERIETALAEFSRDHHGVEPTSGKLSAVFIQAQKDQKQYHDIAPGMTLAQAHALRQAATFAHTPLGPLVKLAAGHRAFDDTFTAADGRKPGLVQISDDSFLVMVQQYGKYFPQTEAIAARMNAPDKNGHVPAPWKLQDALKHEVLALRESPLISAAMGAQYAKHHPVQVDTLKCYLNETGKGDAKHLETLFSRQGGIPNFDPSLTYTAQEQNKQGKWYTATHETNPWCAAMANTTLACCSAPQTKDGDSVSLAAASFFDYGAKVDPKKDGAVKPGDVVVFTHPNGKHHVAFVYDVQGEGKDATFRTIGGNQGGGPCGSVSISQPRRVEGGNDGVKRDRGDAYVFREPPPNAFAAEDRRLVLLAQRNSGAATTMTAKPHK